MPIVIRNAMVKRLNTAIVRMFSANTGSPEVAALYNSWGHFLMSPEYRWSPDVALYPTYQDFARDYVALAKSLGYPPENVDATLADFAAASAQVEIENLEHAADEFADAATHAGDALGRAILVPAVIAIVVLVLWNK